MHHSRSQKQYDQYEKCINVLKQSQNIDIMQV